MCISSVAFINSNERYFSHATNTRIRKERLSKKSFLCRPPSILFKAPARFLNLLKICAMVMRRLGCSYDDGDSNDVDVNIDDDLMSK